MAIAAATTATPALRPYRMFIPARRGGSMMGISPASRSGLLAKTLDYPERVLITQSF